MPRGIPFKDYMGKLITKEDCANLLLLQEAYFNAEQKGDEREARQIKELYDKLVPPEIAEIISKKREGFSNYSNILETLAEYVCNLGDELELGKHSIEQKAQTL